MFRLSGKESCACRSAPSERWPCQGAATCACLWLSSKSIPICCKSRIPGKSGSEDQANCGYSVRYQLTRDAPVLSFVDPLNPPVRPEKKRQSPHRRKRCAPCFTGWQKDADVSKGTRRLIACQVERSLPLAAGHLSRGRKSRPSWTSSISEYAVLTVYHLDLEVPHHAAEIFHRATQAALGIQAHIYFGRLIVPGLTGYAPRPDTRREDLDGIPH